ncbi:MAG: peptidylprolyl isomerase [Ferruginibacter sp.]|nr:hypothetical protein [Ferruginibacter sp.]
MKHLIIFCSIFLTTLSTFAQTLFTYGKNQTSKQEFFRAYNKNKPTTSNTEKSLREYLELYSNFKLKVNAAQDLRLDTIAQIKYDVENFRSQVIENYLSDEQAMQTLVKEAADRTTKDIHVLYFSVPLASNATPADTLKVYNAAKELFTNLKADTKGLYNELVSNISATYSLCKFSDVGFVTTFSIPYQFENIIYNTKLNEVSAPLKSAKGYNIFKVIDQRQAVGKWKIAQLLFAFPPKADEATKLTILHKADSVYGLLQHGLNFADAAKVYSDDRMTNLSGGELPEFGTGKYNIEFENTVFGIKNDNDITKPFATSYGYHIVKRLSHTAIPTDKLDASFLYEVKQKVLQDARINTEKEKFAKDIIVKTGFKKVATISDKELFALVDSVFKNVDSKKTNLLPINKKGIISFKDGTQIKGAEWLKFITNNKPVETNPLSANELWSLFTKENVLDYYKKNLEKYNPDFKYQMQEFKEGNMLFEIMERNVWSKASTDTVGLKKHYEANKQNYTWAASANVLVFNCSNDSVATSALTQLQNGIAWNVVVEKSNGQIQADSGRYELAQLNNSNTIQKAGEFSSFSKSTDGTVSFIKYLNLYSTNMQRSFVEARGLVINDYQNELEQQWIQILRKKYPVKLNEAVFKEMLK